MIHETPKLYGVPVCFLENREMDAAILTGDQLALLFLSSGISRNWLDALILLRAVSQRAAGGGLHGHKLESSPNEYCLV